MGDERARVGDLALRVWALESAADKVPASDWSHEVFLTVEEAADLLRVVPQTVRNWMLAGERPFVRVGRRVRIPRSDFERFVGAGRRRRPGRPPSSHGLSDAEGFWDGSWTPHVGSLEAFDDPRR